jgi:hypothetical protein
MQSGRAYFRWLIQRAHVYVNDSAAVSFRTEPLSPTGLSILDNRFFREPASRRGLDPFLKYCLPTARPSPLETNCVPERPQSIGKCGWSRLQDQRRLDFVKSAIPNGGQLGKPWPRRHLLRANTPRGEFLSPRAREGSACRTRIQRAAHWRVVDHFDCSSRAAGVEKVGKAYRSCATGVSCTQWRRSSQIWTFMGVCCAALVPTAF